MTILYCVENAMGDKLYFLVSPDKTIEEIEIEAMILFRDEYPFYMDENDIHYDKSEFTTTKLAEFDKNPISKIQMKD